MMKSILENQDIQSISATTLSDGDMPSTSDGQYKKRTQETTPGPAQKKRKTTGTCHASSLL